MLPSRRTRRDFVDETKGSPTPDATAHLGEVIEPADQGAEAALGPLVHLEVCLMVP